MTKFLLILINLIFNLGLYSQVKPDVVFIIQSCYSNEIIQSIDSLTLTSKIDHLVYKNLKGSINGEFTIKKVIPNQYSMCLYVPNYKVYCDIIKINSAPKQIINCWPINQNNVQSNKPDLQKVFLDVAPEYNGGVDALYDFLKKNLNIPLCNQDQNIKSNYIHIIINKNGKSIFEKLANTTQANIEKEIKRVIEIMPKWNPSRLKCDSISVRFTIACNKIF